MGRAEALEIILQQFLSTKDIEQAKEDVSSLIDMNTATTSVFVVVRNGFIDTIFTNNSLAASYIKESKFISELSDDTYEIQ